jgi:hypothetical protein
MIRNLILILFSISASHIWAQTAPIAPMRYRVYLADKNNSTFSIQQPQEFLSPRAIERRQKQNIPISLQDIPVNPSYIQALQAIQGVSVVHTSKWFNTAVVQVDDTLRLNTIAQLPFVMRIGKIGNGIKKTDDALKLEELIRSLREQQNASIPEIPKPKSGANPIYGEAFNQISMVNGHQLHQQGFSGEGMIIAVLDAGFYKANEFPYFTDAFSEGRILGTRDFVEGGSSVFEDNSHGLSVFSVMASSLPGVITGTAPKASYWLLRSEEAATEFLIEEDNWVRAAEFADSAGVDVINSSLGYTVFDDPSTSHTYQDMNGNTALITRGADIAASKGMLIVNSAGNSGSSPWRYIGAPADGDSVLAIGAVNFAREYASFSSLGPTVDGRIKPNVTAMGQQTVLVNFAGEVTGSNGTSFSGPVIAGLAACLWQSVPAASAMQVFKAIEQSAHLYENPNEKMGFGIPDFVKAQGILRQQTNISFHGDSIVNVFPNPFIEGFSIEFYSSLDQSVDIIISNAKGKKAQSKSFKVSAGSNTQLQMETLKNFKAGTYFVTVQTSTGKHTRKLIKGE